jgi:DNA-binding transcriptional ArsR family regulator
MEAFRILEPNQLNVMASPFRQDLLHALSTPKSAIRLARDYKMSRQRIGYHMRDLERSGCIEVVGERQARGLKEKLYRTKPMAFVYAPRDSELPDATRDRYSWATLVNLAARTLWDVITLRRRADAAGKRLATLALDAELHFETPAERKAFTEALIDAIERVCREHEHSPSDKSRAFRLVLGAYPKLERLERSGESNPKH